MSKNFPNLGKRYNFLNKLGEGGFGVVNLALDRQSGFPVAIKTLHKEMPRNIRDKFKIEANIYLGLNHQNIVQLKEPGLIIKDNQIHLVMEYIEGVTLNDYAELLNRPIDSKVSLSIFKQIVSAVGFAHNKKIHIGGFNSVLHLDLKPPNVFIQPNGDVKVLDYGISQGDDATNEGMGSPVYMAPEQFILNSQLDNRTDIYSLGLILRYMLTDTTFPYSFPPPPAGTTQQEFYHYYGHFAQSKRTIRILESNPNVDKRYQFIIDKATQKDPDERFQSCDELLHILNKIN